MRASKSIICAILISLMLCGCGKGNGSDNPIYSEQNDTQRSVTSSVINANDSEGESGKSSETDAKNTSDVSEKDRSDSTSDRSNKSESEVSYDLENEIPPKNSYLRIFSKKLKNNFTEEQKKELESYEIRSDEKYLYAIGKLYGYEDESGRKVTYDDVIRLLKEAKEKYPLSGAPEDSDMDGKWSYARAQVRSRIDYVIHELKAIQEFVDYVNGGSDVEDYIYFPEVYSPTKPKKVLDITDFHSYLQVVYYEVSEENADDWGNGKLRKNLIMFDTLKEYYDEFDEVYKTDANA